MHLFLEVVKDVGGESTACVFLLLECPQSPTAQKAYGQRKSQVVR